MHFFSVFFRKIEKLFSYFQKPMLMKGRIFPLCRKMDSFWGKRTYQKTQNFVEKTRLLLLKNRTANEYLERRKKIWLISG